MLWTLAATAALSAGAVYVMARRDEPTAAFPVLLLVIVAAVGLAWWQGPRPGASDCTSYSRFASDC
jgi:hypothetical protein